MKMYRILNFSFVAAWLLLGLQPVRAQENFTVEKLRTEYANEGFGLQTRPAKPDIGDFALAFAYAHQGHPLTDEVIQQMTRKNYVNEDVEEFIIDRRAGYMRLNFVSDGPCRMEMCYWNLPDGTKRVAAMLHDVYDEYSYPFLRFYDYDPVRNELVALNPAPVDKQLDFKVCNVALPRVGKDIEVNNYYIDAPAKLVYAGKDGFRYEGPDYNLAHPEENALYCYLISGSSPFQLYDAPGGEMVMQIPPDIYTLAVTEARNGWWRVYGRLIYTMEGEDMFLPEGPYWIDAKNIGLATRNYDGAPVNLLAEPRDDAPVAGTITEEAAGVTPVDATADYEWIKVRWGDVCGWIRIGMLCDNPVSNCC